MKLITEYVDNNLEYYCESAQSGERRHIIEGVFMQADTKNRNGRVYPKGVLESAVNKYVREQVLLDRAVGELDHPEGPTINLDKVSHKITNLRFEGSDVIGKASILKTPMGRIVEGLLEGGVKLGVSSRGMGSLAQKSGASYVGDDFMLATVDIVQDPSAQGAFVNGIMEGREWIWDNNGILTAQDIEKYETEIKQSPKHRLLAVEEAVFKDFLSKL